MTNSTYLQELKIVYDTLSKAYEESGIELSQNTTLGKSSDLLTIALYRYHAITAVGTVRIAANGTKISVLPACKDN